MAVIVGTEAGEPLPGTNDVDLIQGKGGDDTINGGFGNDILYGDEGNDTFVLNGTAGFDSYHGGDGDDIIKVTRVPSYYNYVEIQINYMDSIEAIANDSNIDTYIRARGVKDFSNVDLIDIEGIRGSDSNDYIDANVIYHSSTATFSGVDMWGYEGDDKLAGTVLADVIDGGDGDDTIAGGDGVDQLDGGADNDSLGGGAGNDLLNGGTGDDILLGGTGDDELTGGDGADYFWFENGDGWDVVSDFTDGVDFVVVGASISTVDLYDYYGDALLGFDVGTAGEAYVQLAGVDPSLISGSDLFYAGA